MTTTRSHHRAAGRLVSLASLGGRRAEELQALLTAALAWQEADRQRRAARSDPALSSDELDAAIDAEQDAHMRLLDFIRSIEVAADGDPVPNPAPMVTVKP